VALVTAIPWKTLNPKRFPRPLVAAARRGWSSRAANETATAGMMDAIRAGLAAASAPRVLVESAERFVAEERRHAGLCRELAERLGGAEDLPVEPVDPAASVGELIVSGLCVGEALSFPLLAANVRASTEPAPKAVFVILTREEAGHARFGRVALDWLLAVARPWERATLRSIGERAIRGCEAFLDDARHGVGAPALGSMDPTAYVAAGRRALDRFVRPVIARI
jgi:hypothetical protein